jgi:hypothetical protein
MQLPVKKFLKRGEGKTLATLHEKAKSFNTKLDEKKKKAPTNSKSLKKSSFADNEIFNSSKPI